VFGSDTIHGVELMVESNHDCHLGSAYICVTSLVPDLERVDHSHRIVAKVSH
jgi:hypothetical protein